MLLGVEAAETPPKSPWRKVRIAVLLVMLLVAALRYWQVRRAETWVPDWSASERVAVVLLTPTGLDEVQALELERLLRFAELGDEKATLSALEHWFQVEWSRYGLRDGFKPVELEPVGPLEVSSMPPPPPRVGEDLSFGERYARTRDFLGWFDAQVRDRRLYQRNAVFVTFYPDDQAARFRGLHSVADRRSRRGFVFAPLDGQGRDTALINVAHELLHLFGASDKYEGERCVFPVGWVEPLNEPRLPQRYAEVMAQGIPVAEGRREASLDLFEDMRVGVETAMEIGWIDRARRDRYYAGDASAGPTLE